MNATIWHNPRCSKSRQTLALLEAAGATLTVVDYQASPPSRATLARLFARAGLAPRDGLRPEAPRFASDVAALDAMTEDAKLIERPLVETEKGVRLCRPPERVQEIL